MHTLIYGAGAVGGYFGARLVENGADVTFLARGAQYDALTKTGIRLDSVAGDFNAPVRTAGTLSEAPPADLVLLCVKGHDTPAAARDLARHLPEHAQVVCLQNGMGHLDILADALGAERVISASVFIGVRVASPGVIQHSAAGFIRAGLDPCGTDPEVTRVVDFLDAHGVNITLSQHIRLDMWKKLLWNLGFNGPSALTCATVGDMVSHPGTAWLIHGLMAEALAVGRAADVPLDEGLVAKTFGQTKGLDRFKTSMLQDVEAHRPIENEAVYGYVLAQGTAHGIDTPLTRMVHDALALRYPLPGNSVN